MTVCSFEGCMSGSKRKDVIKNNNVHLHRFPRNVELQNKWLDQIKRGSRVTKVNFETGVVY